MKDIIEKVDEAFAMTIDDDRSTVSISRADWVKIKAKAQKATDLEQQLLAGLRALGIGCKSIDQCVSFEREVAGTVNVLREQRDSAEKEAEKLRRVLGRHSMDFEQAAQRVFESRVARDALGLDPDDNDISPADVGDAIAKLLELRRAAEPFATAWHLRAQRPAQTSGNKVRERRDLEAGFYSVMKPDGERFLLTGHDLKRLGEAFDKTTTEERQPMNGALAKVRDYVENSYGDEVGRGEALEALDRMAANISLPKPTARAIMELYEVAYSEGQVPETFTPMLEWMAENYPELFELPEFRHLPRC